MRREYSGDHNDGDRAAMMRILNRSAMIRQRIERRNGDEYSRTALQGPPWRARRAFDGPRAHGFTLAETAMAVLLVSLLVVGSLQSLSASFRTHKFSQSRIRASLLAEQLLIEISSLSWSDPQAPATAGTIGRDTGDTEKVIHRDQLDDMDDFDDWIEQPPATRSGTLFTGTNALQRQVFVENISATDPTATVADDTDTGIRRVTVTIVEEGTELARVSALLTRTDLTMRSGVYEQRVVPNSGGT